MRYSVLAIVFGALLSVGMFGYGPTPYELPDTSHFLRKSFDAGIELTVEGVELGRHLFYDPILSRDSSFSCSSCHKQGSAFADGGRSFSVGIDGAQTKRNTMPLFNLAWYDAFFWDGRASSIEEQVLHPVRDAQEMDLPWPEATKRIERSSFYGEMFDKAYPGARIDSALIAAAIGQFLRSLISSNSLYDRVLRGETHFDSATYAGFVLVNDQSMADCLHCHTTDADAVGTTGAFSNNGLDPATTISDYNDKGRGAISGKPEEVGHFRIPTLRNVAVTAPYMHDGRFKTLEEVLEFYSEGVHAGLNVDPKMTRAHEGGVRLTGEEKACIISFLCALTDTAFIEDPKFSSPFN